MRMTLTLVVLGTLLPAVGCSGAIVDGSGTLSQETRTLASGFTSIYNFINVNVTVEEGATDQAVIQADDNLLELIETRVDGASLDIMTPPGTTIRSGLDLTVAVTTTTTPTLFDASGSGDLRYPTGTLTTDSVVIEASGAGNVVVPVDASEVTTSMSGAGNVTVTGNSDSLDLTLSGGGNFIGNNLTVSSATVSLSGSGNTQFGASDSVTGTLSGSGDLTITGSAQVTVAETGSGSVTIE